MATDRYAPANFWFSVAGFAAAAILTAGIAYGVMGGDVKRNTEFRKAQGTVTTEILVDLGVARTERKGIQKQLDTIVNLLGE